MSDCQKRKRCGESSTKTKKPCLKSFKEKADELELLPPPETIPDGPISTICPCCCGYFQTDKGGICLSYVVNGLDVGYRHCDECTKIANESIDYWKPWVVSVNEGIQLSKKDMQQVTVRRSSGKIEDDWKIMSDYIFKNKTVKVYKDGPEEEEFIFKYVPLKKLLRYNKHLSVLVE